MEKLEAGAGLLPFCSLAVGPSGSKRVEKPRQQDQLVDCLRSGLKESGLLELGSGGT